MKREFARRCRELMLTAWSAEVQEQLRLWAEELDQQADTLERQLGQNGSEPPENVSAKGDIGRCLRTGLRSASRHQGGPPMTAPFSPATLCNGSRRAMVRTFAFRPANANLRRRRTQCSGYRILGNLSKILECIRESRFDGRGPKRPAGRPPRE